MVRHYCYDQFPLAKVTGENMAPVHQAKNGYSMPMCLALLYMYQQPPSLASTVHAKQRSDYRALYSLYHYTTP